MPFPLSIQAALGRKFEPAAFGELRLHSKKGSRLTSTIGKERFRR